MIRDSFPAKLLVLLLGVALVIGAIGGVIYFQVDSTLESDIQTDMEHSTELQANTLGEWVDRNQNHARTVAGSDAVQSGDIDAIDDRLDEESQRLANSVSAIHYVDLQTGDVVASSDDRADEATYLETELAELEPPAAGESTVTTTYEDPTINTEAVAFVAGVDGRYAILLPVDLEQRIERLERPSETDGSFTHVVNSEGYVVMSHDDPINTQNVGDEGERSPAVQDGLQGNSGFNMMEVDHSEAGHEDEHFEGEMAMGYAPVEGTDWVVMTHIPANNAFALQQEVQWAVIALILVAVIGLGVVGIVVGRNTTRSLRDLASSAEAIESGDLDTTVETERTDEIGQLYGSIDSMRRTLKDNIEDIEHARETAEQERERVERINDDLERTAEQYCSVMGQAADGDLTVRAPLDTDHESMRTIGEEFNEMLAEIEATVEGLRQFATQVATASEQVTASSEEVRSASQQVSESIQEISDGSKRQSRSLQSVNDEMENLSTTTEEIAASSNEVADVAERTAETGRKGREAAQRALAGINTIEQNAESAADEIDRLEEQVGQIDGLIERIKEIAEQTNMLALNANIEASRSGGDGEDEGFGVVAQEVKGLSEDAKEAADEIEERLESIQDQTTHSVEEVQQTREEISEQATAIENAAVALEEIAGYAEETNTGIQEISAATEQQAASTQQIVAMIDESGAISDETTSEAENVAAAAEEQTTALTEVTQSASQLTEQATRLSETLDRFHTDAGVDHEAIAVDADTLGVEGRDADLTAGRDETDPTGRTGTDATDLTGSAHSDGTDVTNATDPDASGLEDGVRDDLGTADGTDSQQRTDGNRAVDGLTDTVADLAEETDDLADETDGTTDPPSDDEEAKRESTDGGVDKSSGEDVFEFGPTESDE